jgi:hypothetical protein
MELQELADLLGITIAVDQVAKYTARLSAAVDHINAECGERFTNADGDVELPASVKMGAAMLVKSMNENPAVASQSLGDMSKSFFEGGTYRAARDYWKRYVRARLF